MNREADEADEPTSRRGRRAEEAGYARADKADEADVANKPGDAEGAKANEANKAEADEADAEADDAVEAIVIDVANYAIVADDANGVVLYSLTKYSTIIAEVKGYFRITAPNNQLGQKSSCSLRSKNRYQLDNQLEVVAEKGLVWSSKHWSNNELGECVAEIGWKTWHNNKLEIVVE